MPILEKIRNLLKPEMLDKLAKKENKPILLQLLKLEKVLDIFLQKESALDYLLQNWKGDGVFWRKHYNYNGEIVRVMDEFKNQIVLEYGSLDEFENALNLCKNEDFPEQDLFLKSIIANLDDLQKCLKEQFEIIKQKDNLLNEITVDRFTKLILNEYKILQNFFVIETRYIYNIKEEIEDMYSRTRNLVVKDVSFNNVNQDNRELFYFINECIGLIKDHKINIVLVTDDSARIIGIMLLDQLKKRGIKIPVVGFNPGPMRIAFKNEVYIKKLIDSFKKERRAITNAIIGKSILVIDEIAASGGTLFSAKYFFEQLRALKVYTAVFSGGTNLNPEFGRPDILGRCEGFTHRKLNRSKDKNLMVTDFDNSGMNYPLTTRTVILRSKYKLINILSAKIVKDYKEYMKKVASGEK